MLWGKENQLEEHIDDSNMFDSTFSIYNKLHIPLFLELSWNQTRHFPC